MPDTWTVEEMSARLTVVEKKIKELLTEVRQMIADGTQQTS